MLTGEYRRQIDDIRDGFWTGGVTNPLTVIKQLTYPLFMKRLVEPHNVGERAS